MTRRGSIALCLCLSALLWACKDKEITNTAPLPPAETLRIGCFSRFDITSPFEETGFNGLVTSLVYDSLMVIGDDLAMENQLAKTIERLRDRKTWRIELSPDIKFHDGSSMTATDVAASFDCAMHSETYRIAYYMLEPIQKITAVDEHSLIIKMKSSTSTLPLGLVLVITRAKYTPCAVPKFSVKELVGSGPYQINSITNDKILLRRNENYWAGLPKIKNISFDFYKDKRAAWAALIKGDLDIIYDNSLETHSVTDKIPHLKTASYPLDFFYMMLFNMHNPVLKDVKLRRALNYAVDRESIIRETLYGYGEPSSGIVRKSADSNKTAGTYSYDPDQALRLFKEAGYRLDERQHQLVKNGRQLTLNVLGFQGDDESAKVLRAVEANLLDLGIKMHIRSVPADQMMSAVTAKRADLFYIYSRAHHNPTAIHSFLSGNPKTAFFPYESQKLQQLFHNYFDGKEPDGSVFLQQFEKIIYDEPPGIFLYWKNSSVVLHRRVEGVNFTSQGFWEKIWQWSINAKWQQPPG